MSRRCPVVMVTPALSDQGGIASVVTSYFESPLAQEWDITLIETVRGRGVLRHVRGLIGVVKACNAIARRDRCLVHVHMSFGGSFWRKACVIAFARRLGRPTILHLHGSKFASWAVGAGSVRSSAVRRVFGMADTVVVLSESWRCLVAEFAGRDDGIVVPNPVAIPDATSTGRDSEFVVFLGRLGERKGVFELVAAIEALQNRGSGAHWLVAGDGDVEDVREAVSKLPRPELVSVPGWLGRDDVRAALARASVFCLPSHDEGVPIALLEAMSYGLACVVTPVGGMPEVIVNGENGVLVAVGNADALEDGLGRVLSDSVMRRELGDRARETVVERYALGRVADEVGALYESLCSTRAQGGE